MQLTGVRAFGEDFAQAERFADEWAGDNAGYAVIVEDFSMGPDDADFGALLVMDHEEGEQYLEEHDAEIIYHADHRAADAMP